MRSFLLSYLAWSMAISWISSGRLLQHDTVNMSMKLGDGCCHDRQSLLSLACTHEVSDIAPWQYEVFGLCARSVPV